jgi:hypothetical protein
MTMQNEAYERTVRAIRRLSKAYGYEYVVGIACQGMPEHLEMRREREERMTRSFDGSTRAAAGTRGPSRGRNGWPSGAFAPKEARGLSSRDGDHDAADRHATLPMELRLLALGLSIPENWARAA